MFLWLHLIRFLWLQLVFSPHVNKALWHTGAFFFGCDWLIDLASTRVFAIWNQLSNMRFLPLNWLCFKDHNLDRSSMQIVFQKPWTSSRKSAFQQATPFEFKSAPHLSTSTSEHKISSYFHTIFHLLPPYQISFHFCLHRIFHSWYIYLQILSSLPFTI